MYSSHRICSVTCLRFSSRCTAAQSGSADADGPAWSPAAVQPGLQHGVGHVRRQRPGQARSLETTGPSRAPSTAPRRSAGPHRDRRQPAVQVNLIISRTWRIAILSVGIGPSQKRRNPSVDEAPDPRSPWRDQIGIPGGIISEWVARSDRNRWRHQIGMGGGMSPEIRTVKSVRGDVAHVRFGVRTVSDLAGNVVVCRRGHLGRIHRLGRLDVFKGNVRHTSSSRCGPGDARSSGDRSRPA